MCSQYLTKPQVKELICFILSLKARFKAEKNRQKAAEQFIKAAHSQRQELAQQRREEKKRAEKEKLMSEEDPDRARKLEVS